MAVSIPVCGRSGLLPFRFWTFQCVAISVCGRLDFGCSGLWPVWPKNEWEHRLTALWTTPNVNVHSFLGIKHSVIRIVFLPYSCCKSYFYWKTLPCYRRSCNTCPHTDACHRTVDKAQAHITPIFAINFCFTEESHIYGGVEGPPHIFFRHHAISYGWHSNSSVGDSNYCYVIRRTY